MAEEKKSIFRKESLDRISSPEEYDRYLQVTGPGVWMTLGAVVLLLVGAVIWAVFGRLNTNINVAVVSEGKSVVCLLPAERAEDLKKEQMKVKIADKEYTMMDAGRAPELVTEDMDLSVRLAGGLVSGKLIYRMNVDAELDEGVYTGEIQVEQVAPIDFILN